VRAGAGPDELRSAIAGLGPAIELADLEAPPTDPEAILTANIFQRHVILGPVDEARDGSADGISARILVNGSEAARTDDPTALTGDLLYLTAHVAATLEASGERLRAGHVIITGAVVPPMPVSPGDDVVVELPPLGTLAVRLSD
jgi:2-keto-4-pentenoate hydratase